MTKSGKKQAPQKHTTKSKKPAKVKTGVRKIKAKSRTHKPQKATRSKPQAKPQPLANVANAQEVRTNAESGNKAQEGPTEPESRNKDQEGFNSEAETKGIGRMAPENQKPTEPVYESKNPSQGLTKPESTGLSNAEANNGAEVRTKVQNEVCSAPKLNIHLTLKKIGADFVAYDLEHKTAFKLDPLAFLICTLCDGRNTTAQIAQKLEALLRAENLAPPVSLNAEVETVINALSQNGVVFVD